MNQQGRRPGQAPGIYLQSLKGGLPVSKGSETMESKGELGRWHQQPWVYGGPWMSASLGTFPFLGS